MDDIIRFSVSLPKSLLQELDAKIEQQGYASRSELTRDLIREKIIKDSWETSTSELIGVMSIIYLHEQNEIVNKILNLEHQTKIKIMCITHVNIDPQNCLDTFVLRGKSKDIKLFCDKISGTKGVKFSELVKAAITTA
ncbi:nickel-responsive transcriptional regulator NikR [Campylobacter sp. 9BO]|uniref:nickel-responsive transcriptional regulator NikR n=1 Tax=Campylobacter sp. 9BO TaxID=3424759 RepID=UPI003D355410